MARCPTCHRRLLGATCATHGTVSVPSATTALALDVVPVWSQPLTRLVGRGGFASVWEISGGGVLKVAHASHDLARARMRREAEALAAVGAPAVPRLLDRGVLDDGRAWIAMEHVAGTPLGDVLATGPLRIDQAISIGDAILASLARVHAAGFVHRDLKPDNLISAKGAITLLDLGLARRLPDDPDDPTRAGVQVGSLEYMAPEQLRDAAAAGTRADIYAFGCVLYELCAGRPPFVGDASGLERAHAALRPPPLAALATVPPPLEALVHDCLAKLPERRPASVTELRTRLVALRDATPSLQRVQHSGSLIREGKQPIVLLWAELPKVDRTLLGMLAARKITVISQRGRRVLGGVVGADHADPAGAAIAAARDLAAAGARVALHLDAYVVTTGRSGATIDGVTEDWLPGSAWTGIVVTRALAAVIQTPTRPCELPGFVMLGEPAQAVELFGRDGLITELATDAAVALAKQGPALALLVGEPGIGKTSIARALIPQLRDLGARVVAGDVPPPGAGKPGHAALAELVESPGVRAIGDALRRAAREQPLAIIVDNAHLAEPDLLDALEYATLGGEPLALWVLVIASPRLEQRRPGFGARAERHRRDVVPPLDEEPAVALTTALLRPAEYPPLRALRQIASIARGNPMHLTTLVREIHDRGAIRTRPNGEHFLDTTALDALPTIALGPWLAARELAHLSPELAGLARVCAVLGDEIDRAELRAVVESVERRGGATTTLDVDVGLRELEAAGIVTGTSFKQALLAEGIYATTHEDERRAIHAAALEYWQREGAHPQRIARHAEAVGKKPIAARAYAQLGIEAERAHRALDADQMFQGALRNSEARDALHVRALIGRARARTRAQRLTDALADLDEAVAIARAIGDVGLEVEALLDQATALDWTQDFAASKAAALRASELAGAQPAVRFAVARGAARACGIGVGAALGASRDEDRARAESELAVTMRDAREAGNVALEIDAGLVLAGAQVELGKLADAEGVLARVIALCEASGDRFHLGAAYNNRTALWSARGDIERVDRDLLDVIQLAREAGQAFVERAATYNLAEDRLWQGDLDEALRLARRSLALQRGHGEGSTRLDEMLLARILAGRGDRDELRAVLAQLATYDLDDDERKFFAVLDAVANAGALEPALDAAEGLSPPHRLELLHLARPLSDTRRAEAKSLATGDAIWSRRVDTF